MSDAAPIVDGMAAGGPLPPLTDSDGLVGRIAPGSIGAAHRVANVAPVRHLVAPGAKRLHAEGT